MTFPPGSVGCVGPDRCHRVALDTVHPRSPMQAATKRKVRRAAHYARERRNFWMSATLTFAPPAGNGRDDDRHPSGSSPALAAARARDARAVLVRLALLRRCMERAPERRREHGRAGCTRHDHGVAVQHRRHRARLHEQHVYFEASAAVITLVLLGKLLEARAKGKTSTRSKRSSSSSRAPRASRVATRSSRSTSPR